MATQKLRLSRRPANPCRDQINMVTCSSGNCIPAHMQWLAMPGATLFTYASVHYKGSPTKTQQNGFPAGTTALICRLAALQELCPGTLKAHCATGTPQVHFAPATPQAPLATGTTLIHDHYSKHLFRLVAQWQAQTTKPPCYPRQCIACNTANAHKYCRISHSISQFGYKAGNHASIWYCPVHFIVLHLPSSIRRVAVANARGQVGVMP